MNFTLSKAEMLDEIIKCSESIRDCKFEPDKIFIFTDTIMAYARYMQKQIKEVHK